MSVITSNIEFVTTIFLAMLFGAYCATLLLRSDLRKAMVKAVQGMGVPPMALIVLSATMWAAFTWGILELGFLGAGLEATAFAMVDVLFVLPKLFMPKRAIA